MKAIYDGVDVAHKRLLCLTIFVVWLGVVSFFAWTHLVWRDEVRALSLALQGDSMFAMLNGLHGEGHPAIWYLLLRAGHGLIPHLEILLVLSILVAAAAMLVLVLRAPFSLPFLALLLSTHFSTYEYSVMARNYGLSMLLLFLFAVFYRRHRDRDCLPGVLLFLLANCNVPSALLVGGLLLFWFMDVCGETANRQQKIRMFLYNAALAAIGIGCCFITIFPTYNDAAVIDPKTITFKMLIQGVFLPSLQLNECCGIPGSTNVVPLYGNVLLSLLLFGSTLGLIGRPSAFVAALATLVGFSLYFVIIYPGAYRHQALWLVFIICMYWLAAPRTAQNEPISEAQLKPLISRLSTAGTWLFVLVMLMQLPFSVQMIFNNLSTPIAVLANRKDDVSAIFERSADLRQAVIVADPDFLVETLPYYVSNPTYLMREQRYGNVVHFTRGAKLVLSLGDVLTNARRLRQATGRSVVLLLSQKIDSLLSKQVYEEGYNWKFVVTPEQARDLRSSTRLLGHHSSLNGTDENYYVYELDK